MAAEVRSMAALELAAAVAAFVVVALEGDEEELPWAAGSRTAGTGHADQLPTSRRPIADLSLT